MLSTSANLEIAVADVLLVDFIHPDLDLWCFCADMGLQQLRFQQDYFADTVRELGLWLNPKTAVHPWQRGIDFCGYRIWPTHILPRKRNIKRARADFRKLAKAYAAGRADPALVRQRVDAFRAYTKHCNAEKTTKHVLQDLERRATGTA